MSPFLDFVTSQSHITLNIEIYFPSVSPMIHQGHLEPLHVFSQPYMVSNEFLLHDDFTKTTLLMR